MQIFLGTDICLYKNSLHATIFNPLVLAFNENRIYQKIYALPSWVLSQAPSSKPVINYEHRLWSRLANASVKSVRKNVLMPFRVNEVNQKVSSATWGKFESCSIVLMLLGFISPVVKKRNVSWYKLCQNRFVIP